LGFYVYSYAAQPDGASLAVGLHNPANTDVKGFTPVDLYIVAPDGHVVAEMKDIYWERDLPPLQDHGRR